MDAPAVACASPPTKGSVTVSAVALSIIADCSTSWGGFSIDCPFDVCLLLDSDFVQSLTLGNCIPPERGFFIGWPVGWSIRRRLCVGQMPAATARDTKRLRVE